MSNGSCNRTDLGWLRQNSLHVNLPDPYETLFCQRQQLGQCFHNSVVVVIHKQTRWHGKMLRLSDRRKPLGLSVQVINLLNNGSNGHIIKYGRSEPRTDIFSTWNNKTSYTIPAPAGQRLRTGVESLQANQKNYIKPLKVLTTAFFLKKKKRKERKKNVPDIDRSLFPCHTTAALPSSVCLL